MLYRFKSKDAGDVIMLEPHGRRVLEIIGKHPGPKGIILAEQMPAAIEALQAAIVQEEAVDHDPAAEPIDGLGLRHRARPFIELLKVNHNDGHDVVWGV